MPAPILPEIVRQHAEMAAHLWNIYDRHLLNPDENPDMDEERLARLVERLEAHLDGLRVAGADGLTPGRAYARPVASSRPRCTFMHCTAAPLAPLPRLSSRHISSSCDSFANTKSSTRFVSLHAWTSK